MRTVILASALLLPTQVFAAGTVTPDPPKETKTVTECTNGQIFDQASETCVDAKDARLNDEDRMNAVRELAYAGNHQESLNVLTTISDQSGDLVLTYYGFNHRALGDMDTSMAYYSAALTQNPDNILARSYMGQAFLKQGDITAARAELTEIRKRGGRNTWAEASLAIAIKSGRTFSY